MHCAHIKKLWLLLLLLLLLLQRKTYFKTFYKFWLRWTSLEWKKGQKLQNRSKIEELFSLKVFMAKRSGTIIFATRRQAMISTEQFCIRKCTHNVINSQWSLKLRCFSKENKHTKQKSTLCPLWKLCHTLDMSPCQVVIEGDSCLRIHEIEAQHQILDGKLSHIFVEKIV